MLNTPFSPWPSFTQEEGEAVKATLLSNRVNQWTGDRVKQFEKEFASWVGSAHAVALSNGTLALDACWHAIDLRPGDEVIVTPRSFFASVSSIVNRGARPVFADVDPASQNITPETVAPLITAKTRAILCVHLAGWPCRMDEFQDLVAGKSIALVEDCAQAHGASLHGRSVGTWSEIAAWSFCQDKIITTGGEGGMITTDHEDLWRRAWAVKDHGKSWAAVYEKQHPPGFRWLHESFGHNWRMLEMQAVLGSIQLTRMPQWHAARAHNAAAIMAAAARHSLFDVPNVPNTMVHAWYKAYIQLRPQALAPGWSRDRIISEINALGVPCYSGSCSEMYLEKAFDETGLRPAQRLPVAHALGETSLMFLVHPTLTPDEIRKTCEAIETVAHRATR